MSRSQRNVPAPTRSRHEAVAKPEPPADLWSQLDRLVVEVSKETRPPDTFTSDDLMKRHGICRNAALKRIRKLIALGKIEVAGRETMPKGGRRDYYRLTR